MKILNKGQKKATGLVALKLDCFAPRTGLEPVTL